MRQRLIILAAGLMVVAPVVGQQTKEPRPNERVVLKWDKHKPYCLAFSPDGRFLAAGSQEGAIRVWEIANGRSVVLRHDYAGPVQSVAFSPDGKTLATGMGFGDV